MKPKECIAMLLAGGQGSRLYALTQNNAKPAVSFGGKYRIIDFSLSNCTNSGIDTVGVLTQYRPMILNAYIGTGEAWDLNNSDGGVHVLPPYATQKGGAWYEGTADAIYRNIDFIDAHNPEYVLILSADHLYKMDYNKMLQFHKENNADLTVSVIEVPMEEASRFGIMSVDENMCITRFAEKPKNPESNLASMGIYIFTWSVLRDALLRDHTTPGSEHDFGGNIIPTMLAEQKRLFAYTFSGYWKDVGTIDSYYDSQFELLEEDPAFNIFEDDMRIYSNSNMSPPHYVGPNARVDGSLICNGCTIYGRAIHSILASDVHISAGAEVRDCIILPGARIEAGARLVRTIVNEGVTVPENTIAGTVDGEITLIGE